MNAPATCNQQDAGANSIHITAMNKATSTVPLARTEINLSEKDLARFWAKVNKNGPTQPHMETPCWLWTASKDGKGYGAFKAGGKQFIAHRMSWMILHGLITPGFCGCHRCDTPTCVNPAHIFLGTHADNVRDRDYKKRANPVRGTSHGRAILTEAKVIDIRARYAAGGISQRELSALFGVSREAISVIIRRVKWKHVA